MSAASQPETPASPRPVARRQESEPRTLLICMNRRAGSGSMQLLAADILRKLEAAGYVLDVVAELASLNDRALALQQSGQLRAAIAMGGDGTASAVRSRVPFDVPLLVLPMGTENLLGRHLQQTTAPADVLNVVANGVIIDLDLGWANGSPFLLMISAGFDAEVIRSLHENRRGNIRHSTYLLPILRALTSYEFSQMHVYWGTDDGIGSEPQECRWLFGFNLPLYALGLPIAVNAVATDGLLNVCMFDRGSFWSVARYLWHVARGAHAELPDTRIMQTRRLRIEPKDNTKSIAYQVDGDFGGTLPVDVEIVPKQLRLLVSPETAQRLGFALPNAAS